MAVVNSTPGYAAEAGVRLGCGAEATNLLAGGLERTAAGELEHEEKDGLWDDSDDVVRQ